MLLLFEFLKMQFCQIIKAIAIGYMQFKGPHEKEPCLLYATGTDWPCKITDEAKVCVSTKKYVPIKSISDFNWCLTHHLGATEGFPFDRY